MNKIDLLKRITSELSNNSKDLMFLCLIMLFTLGVVTSGLSGDIITAKPYLDIKPNLNPGIAKPYLEI